MKIFFSPYGHLQIIRWPLAPTNIKPGCQKNWLNRSGLIIIEEEKPARNMSNPLQTPHSGYHWDGSDRRFF
ncbi:MAG: hypothetical protein F6K35_29865, partial [Okeania sp. SIO2H7]|nr:hypothetical protein [Okeania sp. SIO2H7]